MSVRADFGFSDATPAVTCRGVPAVVPEVDDPGCGQVFYGDAVVDAFRSWWKHQAAAHPDAHD